MIRFLILLSTTLLTSCAQGLEKPDFAEESIREHVWTNLGAPMSVGVRDDGIEGWLYKNVQLFGSSCKYFTVWFDGEFVFLQKGVRTSTDMKYCREKEEVDLGSYDPSAPRSELKVREREELLIY